MPSSLGDWVSRQTFKNRSLKAVQSLGSVLQQMLALSQAQFKRGRCFARACFAAER